MQKSAARTKIFLLPQNLRVDLKSTQILKTIIKLVNIFAFIKVHITVNASFLQSQLKYWHLDVWLHELVITTFLQPLKMLCVV